MKIICHNDTRFSRCFSFGAKAPLVNMNEISNLKPYRRHTIVCTGLGRIKLIKRLISAGINYFFIDRGYLLNESKRYLRVSYNSFQMNQLLPISNWRNEELAPLPWKRNGEHILICPPSRKTGEFFGFDSDKWLKDTVKNIQKHSEREIIIRHKPKSKMKRNDGESSFSNSIEKAHIVVVFNSNCGTEAIFGGVPVLTLGPSASSFMSIQNIKDIESPIYPNRENWLKNIMYNQFTKDELASGEALEILCKIHNLKQN